MVGELCRECNNWFLDEAYEGEYTIENHAITLSFLTTGQYYRIIGSKFNDGVYKYGSETLTNETFSGSIWAMKVPPEFITLANTISNSEAKTSSNARYTSESWGGYSYTVKGDGSWQESYKRELNRWRKL